ncbi:unnamed protein product [Caretta caretta]
MLSALISAYLVNTHRSHSLFHGYLEDRNLRHQNRAGIHRKIKWHEKPTTMTVYYPCGGNLWTVSNPFIIKAD